MKLLRRAPLALASLAALATLASGGVAHASGNRTFPSGSLIIPMDLCYQPATGIGSSVAAGYCPETRGSLDDGLIKSYGLVYNLLAAGVPIYEIINPSKTASGAIDVTLSNGAATPVTLLNNTSGVGAEFMVTSHYSISYRGGPFMVDGTNAAAAIAVIKADAASSGAKLFVNVNVHVAKMSFVAPVATTLTQKPPKIALMDIGNAAIGVLTGYLTDAGLYTGGTVASYPSIGSIFTQFTQVSNFTTSNGLVAGGFSILWAPHWEGTNATGTNGGQANRNAVVSKISAFLDAGHPVFAQCAAIGSLEGADPNNTSYGANPGGTPGNFLTSGAPGLATNTLPQSNSPSVSWPTNTSTQSFTVNANYATNPLVQVGDYPIEIEGLSYLMDFTPDTGVFYNSGVQRMVASTAPASQSSYNNLDLEIISNKDNDPTKGQIIYLGGHSCGSSGSTCDSTGCSTFSQTQALACERLILNTLIFLGTCTPTTCAAQGASCGTISDGCGNTLTCGSCPGVNGVCTVNVCNCTPNPNPCAGKCGTIDNGCGTAVNCGGCTSPQSCGGGGTANVCGCTPVTCAASNTICGSIPDGCGGTLVCGPPCPTGSCSGASGALLDPVSMSTRFSAGSLIIPMDYCYNPDTGGNTKSTNTAGACVTATTATCYATYSGGNVRLPYGLVYMLAQNNIPVGVALNPAKVGLADTDFTVAAPNSSASPTAQHLVQSGTTFVPDSGLTVGTSTISYRGMPFVIDGAYAAQALQVIATFNNANANLFGPVPIHVANYGFTAPIIGQVSTRPKPVGLYDTTAGTPLATFFTEAGIPSVVAGGATSAYVNLAGAGSAWSYAWPATYVGANAYCSGGTCNGLVDQTSGNRILDAVWTDSGALNAWTGVQYFFEEGGTLLAVGAGHTWETGATAGAIGGTLAITSTSATTGPFCSAVGQAGAQLGTPGPATQYPASDRMLQVDQFNLASTAAGGDGSGYSFSTAPAVNTHVISNGTVDVAMAAHPIVETAQEPGELVYLGALSSWSGTAQTTRDAGQHIALNTLLPTNGGQCGARTTLSAVELSRSSPVADLVSTNASTPQYRTYQGSFDWYVPTDPTLMGATLYQPNPATYPFMTGHFREYKSVGSYTNNSATSFTTCNASSLTSGCNWDAASQMKPFAQRNVYVGSVSGTTYTLTKASSLVATDNTVKFISQNLDVKNAAGTSTAGLLGAIDWSTAAVVEGKPIGNVSVASAKGRPTLAYVGGRDGMIHCFCVAPPTGSTQCFNAYNPGDEVWAIIPPGVKTQMNTAYNSGGVMNWSTINIGGSFRVADVLDNFEPTGRASGEAAAPLPVWRTVLIVGAHDSGYVDALDISSPDPANLNTAGFQLLWEQDGTRIASTATGVTAYAMGGTSGITLSATNSSGGAVGVVAAATCVGYAGASCTSSTLPGLNTYVLELNDGALLGSNQKTYSKKTSLAQLPVPNDVPPIPTVLDVDQNGTDESIYVPDGEGLLRKLALSTSGSVTSLSSTVVTLMDATGGGRCSTGIACQPLGTSPAIVRNGSSSLPTFGVVIGSGGADWARVPVGNSSTGFDMFAVDASGSSTLTPYFIAPLGSVTPPASAAGGGGPGIELAALGYRSYAQPTLAGTDLYADLTTISVGNINQMAQADLTPALYGTVDRWASFTTTPTTTAIGVLPGGTTSYAGGAASVLETNTAATDGQLFLPGATGPSAGAVQALTTTSTSLNTSTAAVSSSGLGVRTFKTLTWYDSSN